MQDQFMKDKQERGILYALREHYPALCGGDRRVSRKLEAYERIRQRFISHVMKTQGVSYTEAQEYVDASGSPYATFD